MQEDLPKKKEAKPSFVELAESPAQRVMLARTIAVKGFISKRSSDIKRPPTTKAASFAERNLIFYY